MPSEEAIKAASKLSQAGFGVGDALDRTSIARIIDEVMQPRLCQGCGTKILSAATAPSWDAISPTAHEELNEIVKSIQDGAIQREKDDKSGT